MAMLRELPLYVEREPGSRASPRCQRWALQCPRQREVNWDRVLVSRAHVILQRFAATQYEPEF